MHEQVPDRHFTRHPRVVHLEPRHVVDNAIVPGEIAAIHQHRERGGRERLADRAELKDGVGVDALGLAQCAARHTRVQA